MNQRWIKKTKEQIALLSDNFLTNSDRFTDNERLIIRTLEEVIRKINEMDANVLQQEIKFERVKQDPNSLSEIDYDWRDVPTEEESEESTFTKCSKEEARLIYKTNQAKTRTAYNKKETCKHIYEYKFECSEYWDTGFAKYCPKCGDKL